jgi:hypothetical protein
VGEILDPLGTERLADGTIAARRSGKHTVLHH